MTDQQLKDKTLIHVHEILLKYGKTMHEYPRLELNNNAARQRFQTNTTRCY